MLKQNFKFMNGIDFRYLILGVNYFNTSFISNRGKNTKWVCRGGVPENVSTIRDVVRFFRMKVSSSGLNSETRKQTK